MILGMSATDQRRAAEAKLNEVRQKIGAAQLDGGDTGKLMAEADSLAREIHLLTAAEAEADRRERERRADLEANRIGSLRKSLADKEAARLDCVERLQRAATNLGAEMTALRLLTEDIDKTLGDIGGSHRPSFQDMWERLTGRIGLVLMAVAGANRTKFHRLSWAVMPYASPTDSWREKERLALADWLAPFIGEKAA